MIRPAAADHLSLIKPASVRAIIHPLLPRIADAQVLPAPSLWPRKSCTLPLARANSWAELSRRKGGVSCPIGCSLSRSFRIDRRRLAAWLLAAGHSSFPLSAMILVGDLGTLSSIPSTQALTRL